MENTIKKFFLVALTFLHYPSRLPLAPLAGIGVLQDLEPRVARLQKNTYLCSTLILITDRLPIG